MKGRVVQSNQMMMHSDVQLDQMEGFSSPSKQMRNGNVQTDQMKSSDIQSDRKERSDTPSPPFDREGPACMQYTSCAKDRRDSWMSLVAAASDENASSMIERPVCRMRNREIWLIPPVLAASSEKECAWLDR